MKKQEEISNLKSKTENWYLGIDFGTQGLSAAILNRSNGRVYPIYWQQLAENLTFKLASKVELSREKDRGNNYVLFREFKHFLKVGIPYVKVEVTRQKPEEKQTESFLLASNFSVLTSPEPMVQWCQDSQVSLGGIKQGLVALLATLKNTNYHREEGRSDASQFSETPEVRKEMGSDEKLEIVSLTGNYICRAEGLELTEFLSAIEDLKGVILGCPASWSEAYRFNLREAVLEAGLVGNIEKVFIVEDAIATLFSEVKLEDNNNNLTGKTSGNNFRKGGTLIINAGATTTELALVSLPDNLLNLNYSDFTCHTYNYGGNAIDQDIVCQLLLGEENFRVGSQNKCLPRSGMPDLSIRYQLQPWLESSPLRMALLQSAKNLKIILQEEERFTFKIGDRTWQVKRRDLESKVLVPFVQQLNRELNSLLTKVGMSSAAINQAICTGGTSCLPALNRWLRQKLPNAIILRDEPEETTETILERIYNLPAEAEIVRAKTSRVAYGLASLGLYPQMLENPRQQYGDYFLLGELLKVVPAQPLKKQEIIELLESRGINTRVCLDRIELLVEGLLPSGLIPSEEDLVLLTPESRQNSDYQSLRGRPLFSKRRGGTYLLNFDLAEDVGQYLGRVVATSRQKLEEPLVPLR
jgi:hypothetical protein